jgi:RimJ/RimL family protein N-acetyltransferase
MMAPAHLRCRAMTDHRTVTTPRLIMAPHVRGDFADLKAMWADPRVMHFLGGAPASEEDSWARLLRYAGSWSLLGFGFWAVRRADTGAYVGDVGFLEGRRSGVDGFHGDPEIGWALTIDVHGQGFATEAVQAALGWGAVHFAGTSQRTVAMINPDNVASVAVAARCGFRHFAVARYKDAPTGLWERRFRS